VHRMIEQTTVDLPHTDRDTNPPVSIYLVHLSRWSRNLKQPASEHRIFGAPTRGRVRFNREHRQLLAAVLDRKPPQLEAPAEPPQTVEEGPGDAQPRSDSGEAHEGVQQRPRWRRMLGR